MTQTDTLENPWIGYDQSRPTVAQIFKGEVEIDAKNMRWRKKKIKNQVYEQPSKK